MLHPDTILKFINPDIGHGVFATNYIPKGTLTWVCNELDMLYSLPEINAFNEDEKNARMTHCYRNNKGQYVYSTDNARYVNHSSDPSCMLTAYQVEIAIRDIHPGDQLTVDYGTLNIIEPFECLPEPGIERCIIYPDDLLRYHEVWDKKLISAFKQYNRVTQPLSVLLTEEQKRKFAEIAEGHIKMSSILSCYYDETNVSYI